MRSPVTRRLLYFPLLIIAAWILLLALDDIMLSVNKPSPSNPNESSIPIIDHHTKPFTDTDISERRRIIREKFIWALKPENRRITLIINSCGRLDLLSKTIKSFEKHYPHNKYPLYERIIVDDSRNESFAHELINRYYPKYEIILTSDNEFENNYTQRDERITYAMDKLYSQVTTPWIYHIEDDWLFTRYRFIQQSFDIFETTIPEKFQTGKKWGLINKFGDESAYRYPESNHDEIEHFWFDPNTIYSVVLCWNMYRKRPFCNRTYLYEYKDSQWYNMKYHVKKDDFWGSVTWGGFSFNAGLQPTFLYEMYGKFFSPMGEWGKSQQLIKDGFKIALMAPPACDHIGRGRHIVVSNKYGNLTDNP